MTFFHFLVHVLAFGVLLTALLLVGAILDLPRCKDMFRGWDYFLAAVICGGDGRHSVSAYCGRAQALGGPVHLVVLGAFIDLMFRPFHYQHCRRAAIREGLLTAEGTA